MTLKDNLYRTIHRNRKPPKAIAEEIGVSENYLYRAALPDPDESDTGTGCRFPLKKLIPLVRATGDYSVLDYIERTLGRVAVALPDGNGGALGDVCRMTLRAVAEFGELMREVEKSMADGLVTAEELERVQIEAHQAVAAIMRLIKTMERGK